MKDSKGWDAQLIKEQLTGGLCVLIIGLISSTRYFSGRKVTLIVLCMLFTATHNIIWISLTDIYMAQDRNFRSGKGNIYRI